MGEPRRIHASFLTDPNDLRADSGAPFGRPPGRAATIAAFVRGLLIRIAYGAVGLALVMAIRPDFLGANFKLLIGSVAVYLLVCVAGGIVDAAGRGDVRWLPRLSAARALSVLAVIVALVVLWLDR